jgi:hypothetical protein
MPGRAFKRSILLIIFGVPVCWYLFLQLFGENKFELAVEEDATSYCSIDRISFVFTGVHMNTDERNQFARLKEFCDSKKITIFENPVDCTPKNEKALLFLIDDQKQIRGFYGLTIRDIDRAIVELDLLLTLQE